MHSFPDNHDYSACLFSPLQSGSAFGDHSAPGSGLSRGVNAHVYGPEKVLVDWNGGASLAED